MDIRCMPDQRLSEAERSVIEYINKQQCIINLLSISDIMIYGYTQSIYSNRIFGDTSRLGLLIITRTILEYMEADIARE